MTDRIELLKEVARVAPKEMKARYFDLAHDYQGVAFTSGDYEYVFTLDGDDESCGSQIIVMLDAMEKVGYDPTLYRTAADDDDQRYEVNYSYTSKTCPTCFNSDFIHRQHYGATRAEVVARAFVAVFKEKEA